MTDTQLLDEKLKESGYKIGFIIDKLGISRTAWDKKKKNMIPFKGSEVYVICDLLKLSDTQKNDIFFAENVEPQTTRGGQDEI